MPPKDLKLRSSMLRCLIVVVLSKSFACDEFRLRSDAETPYPLGVSTPHPAMNLVILVPLTTSVLGTMDGSAGSAESPVSHLPVKSLETSRSVVAWVAAADHLCLPHMRLTDSHELDL
jgi:hypothetical protein